MIFKNNFLIKFFVFLVFVFNYKVFAKISLFKFLAKNFKRKKFIFFKQNFIFNNLIVFSFYQLKVYFIYK